MWKCLVGLTATSPGFRTVRIAPRLDALGPISLAAEFRSPVGAIRSSWAVSAAGVTLSVALPVGVGSATIIVPKPTVPAKVTVVRLGGTVVWDGAKLVCKPSGITGATDMVEGVLFEATNGVYAFAIAAQ